MASDFSPYLGVEFACRRHLPKYEQSFRPPSSGEVSVSLALAAFRPFAIIE